MKKVITYGTYDLLHYGHIALLERAKQLGDYLIVGVTSDAFDKNRGKLNVQQSVVERIEAVKATGLADEIIIEEYEGQKISDIKKYNVDIFAIGSDWYGKFDYLKDLCEVVYLKRTEGISSSELRENQNPTIRLGIIGIENPAERVIQESRYVSGLEICGIYAKESDAEETEKICEKHDLQSYDSLDELLAKSDAVYVTTMITEHAEIIEQALQHGCHVLCESPAFLSVQEARHAFILAKQKNLVLLEAVKTLFFPAFEHLLLIVNSGTIGGVRDVEVSCSIIPDDFEKIKREKYRGSMYDWGNIALTPIMKILGTDFEKCTLYDYEQNGFNDFVRGILKYPHATAAFKIGKGIKTEGDMIITGTNGYIYVPAPWWKTDYFEIRYEDLRDTKKYFFKYDGEGFRYELVEFVKMINHGILESDAYTQKEIMTGIGLIEQFDQGNVEKM